MGETGKPGLAVSIFHCNFAWKDAGIGEDLQRENRISLTVLEREDQALLV